MVAPINFFTAAELKSLAVSFDAITSAHSGNDSQEGLWRKIALALEQGSGVAAPVQPNTTIEGSMYRAAKAAQTAWGGTLYNPTPEGSLRTLASAVETKAGAGSGTPKQRLLARASLTSFP